MKNDTARCWRDRALQSPPSHVHAFSNTCAGILRLDRGTHTSAWKIFCYEHAHRTASDDSIDHTTATHSCTAYSVPTLLAHDSLGRIPQQNQACTLFENEKFLDAATLDVHAR